MPTKQTARMEAVRRTLRTLQEAIFDSATDEWLQLDFTMGQLKALFALRRSGPVPVGGLAEALGIGLPAASILTEKLVQSELVERREDPHDRRRALVGLTPNGEQLALNLWQGRRERLAEMLGRLSEHEFAALVEGLDALARAAQSSRPVREYSEKD